MRLTTWSKQHQAGSCLDVQKGGLLLAEWLCRKHRGTSGEETRMGRASVPGRVRSTPGRGPQTTQAPPFHPRGPGPTSSPGLSPKAPAFKPPVASAYRLDFPQLSLQHKKSSGGACAWPGLEGAQGAMDSEIRCRPGAG